LSKKAHVVKTRQMKVFQAAIIALTALATAPFAVAGPIKLNVTNIRNADGIIRCGLFSSAAGFREPGREISEATARISGGKATCTFKAVPDGAYAVAVFHAEKNERKMDIGLFGKPKQGVGFSRNPSMTFGPPGFEAAAFTVGAAPISLNVKLNY
jgi:uncharacterized protein (DUF2141 family)